MTTSHGATTAGENSASLANLQREKTMHVPKLQQVGNKYGAPMGRPNYLPPDRNAPVKIKLQRLKWCDYDYDEGGAYWGGGSGDYVWRAVGYDKDYIGGNFVEVFVRATNAADAKAAVREYLPNAKLIR